jgi:GNAT superfamily N-acetyltransferase
VRSVRSLREEHRVGLGSVEAVTALLQRVRGAHPTKGLFEAADLQWWWRVPRPTDEVPQLFWFEEFDRPEAAVIVTEWSDRTAFDPIVMPDAAPEFVVRVVEAGVAHADRLGFEGLTLEADPGERSLIEALMAHGFELDGDGLVETWLVADARPPVSPLAGDYRLSSRLETADRPHHMINPKRNHVDPEPRLRQTSLYRPDLDLVVHDADGEVAAYGLFWFDPVTATGLVEPMRTEDEHQRRGLARHVLTAGIDRLARAGAERIKICFEPDNPASKHLYLSVGFEPIRQTIVLSRPAAAAATQTRAMP